MKRAVALIAVVLTLAGCHGGQAKVTPTPTPRSGASPLTLGGPAPVVLDARQPTDTELKALHTVTVGVNDATPIVHALLPVTVQTRVLPLATSATFTSGTAFTVVARVAATSGTTLIVLSGPGYEGHHQAGVASDGIVAATLTLPKLTRGRWSVAVADLSQLHHDDSGTQTGQATVALALFTVQFP